MSVREKIMSYLATAEGTHLHMNRAEDDITSAYGIYRKAFPDAEIFRFYEQIATEFGCDLKQVDCRQKVNEYIKGNPELKKAEIDLAWQFYVDEFMRQDVLDLLDPKSALSWFSISVNGGKGRGGKALQDAINWTFAEYGVPMKIARDGVIGKGTIAALRKIRDEGLFNDDAFNQKLLKSMHNFYKYLIQKNPAKYAMYERGWMNRLKALGYDETRA